MTVQTSPSTAETSIVATSTPPDVPAVGSEAVEGDGTEGLTLSERAKRAKEGKTAQTDEVRLAKIQQSREKVRQQAEASRRTQAQMTQMQGELQQLKNQLTESQAVAQRMQQLQQLVNEDPFAAMHQMGISVDNLAKHGTPEGQIAKFQREFNTKLEAITNEKKQLETQIQTDKRNAAIERAKTEIKGLVDGGEFPTLKNIPFRTVIRDIDEKILSEHQKTGEWMTFRDALAELETEYTPQTAKNETAAKTAEDGQKSQRRAVTNTQTANSTQTTPNLENLTKEQREARIKERLREMWKKK